MGSYLEKSGESQGIWRGLERWPPCYHRQPVGLVTGNTIVSDSDVDIGIRTNNISNVTSNNRHVRLILIITV